jgi:uncharacterized protein YbaR (Trm112 family)
MAGPLGLSENLWEVLACPCDEHSAVVADEQSQMIVCAMCKRRFPVRDGVPVMCLDEALMPPAAER